MSPIRCGQTRNPCKGPRSRKPILWIVVRKSIPSVELTCRVQFPGRNGTCPHYFGFLTAFSQLAAMPVVDNTAFVVFYLRALNTRKVLMLKAIVTISFLLSTCAAQTSSD